MIARYAFWAAALISAATAAQPSLYRDADKSWSIMVPEGWTSPAGGPTTYSRDGSVRCDVTAQADEETRGQTQARINQDIVANYNGAVWERDFLKPRQQKGEIEGAGVIRLDGYAAPWARGWLIYPDSPRGRFGVILFKAPGEIVSVACIGSEEGYDRNKDDIVVVLDSLRPL